MTKFKHKKTGKVIEENLLYYVEKLRNNSNYKEIEDKPSKPTEDKPSKPVEEKNEVEEDKPLQ